MNGVSWIWQDGELVPWEEATVHLGTHALHYGTGVFEGIRAYSTPRGPGVFRLRDHLDRLMRSARLYHMDMPYSREEIEEACWATIVANELDACYLRPIAYRGYRQLGLYPQHNPMQVAVLAFPWGTYHGDDALANGIDVMISSVRRFGPNVLPAQAKACGQYLNSILAKLEAERAGCVEAIMLNEAGRVAEASAENVFVVHNGEVRTPPIVECALGGITRDTVLELCRGLGIPAREAVLDRQDLATADEVFLTGTAAEVTPVRSIDGIELGPPGPITREIQRTYLETVGGADNQWSHHVEYLPPGFEAPPVARTA